MSNSEVIANHVTNFRNWISEVFTKEQIVNGTIDAAGYPNWNNIEETLEKVFEAENLDDYSSSDLENIVYLIARQWDIGIILNWFDKGDRSISQIGMNGYHLFTLAEVGLRTTEIDARYQFAASLYKLGHSERVVFLLLQYYQDEDPYTRRLALRSLSRINYGGIVDKVKEVWENGDEWDRMMCLSIAKNHDEELFNELLEKGKSSGGKYLKEYINRNEYGT